MSARIVFLTGEIFGLISFNDGFVTCNGSGFRCVLQVERRIDLVYGGGSVGLTGLVSRVHDYSVSTPGLRVRKIEIERY